MSNALRSIIHFCGKSTQRVSQGMLYVLVSVFIQLLTTTKASKMSLWMFVKQQMLCKQNIQAQKRIDEKNFPHQRDEYMRIDVLISLRQPEKFSSDV